MSETVLRLEQDKLDTILWAIDNLAEEPELDREHGLRALWLELRAALDSPPVEERVEYRLRGRNHRGEWTGRPRADLGEVRREMERLAPANQGIRIETRSVSETPWTDLPSEEGEPNGK